MAAEQFSKEVKIVRSDNGAEFLCLASFFRENGIIYQTSCALQQNGRVEKKHRHILNVARGLLFQSNLPIKFWGEAIMTVAYLINRTPSAVLDQVYTIYCSTNSKIQNSLRTAYHRQSIQWTPNYFHN